MTLLPVIGRELRAQARQRFTFTLRELGVLGLLACGFFFSADSSLPQNIVGLRLFHTMHLTLFFTIWILVPLSAADCISRERREGTLGLLFLTPLKATDIVVAKSVAHGLRAGTLLVAILPVLTIPFLMGGVSWQLATIAALTNFSAVCWALAGALVASAGTRSGLRAMVGAIVFSLCGMLGFMITAGYLAIFRVGNTGFGLFNWMSHLDEAAVIGAAFAGIANANIPTNALRVFSGPLLPVMFEVAALSLLVLLLAVFFAAWQIRRTWREAPPPLWVQGVQRTFFTPVIWKKSFRRWMRWTLNRNPIGWLERRTWTGRLVTWAWFAIIISIYSAALSDNNFFQHSSTTQTTMAWLMMGSIAASVAGSFRRERESGVLELLLVAPMTTGQIIGGRLRGLWVQFLPAVAVLLGIWWYFAQIFRDVEEYPKIFFFAGTFLTLPVIGLYFSVRCRSYIGAFLLTLIFSLFTPYVLLMMVSLFRQLAGLELEMYATLHGFWAGAVFFQLVFAAWFGVLLYRRLDKRDFPMERALA
ncbi:MAG: hypothetical protein EXS35_14915 [Pedosphaera sp.]|nr:hypothetical protein [Pedosphaera sp.]